MYTIHFKLVLLNSLLDPFIMKPVQVDRGAIPYLMDGANCMCPGLTSPGGRLEADFAAGEFVVIE